MERLTERDAQGNWRIKRFTALLPAHWQACNRLAAYEEMGVEPEEIAALISPPNDPLTLEELREMDGDKIYIQHIGACKGFSIMNTPPITANWSSMSRNTTVC